MWDISGFSGFPDGLGIGAHHYPVSSASLARLGGQTTISGSGRFGAGSKPWYLPNMVGGLVEQRTAIPPLHPAAPRQANPRITLYPASILAVSLSHVIASLRRQW